MKLLRIMVSWLTKNANMGDLISFLENFNLTIREAYLNGRRPELTEKPFDEKWFAQDIRSLLSLVKNAYQGDAVRSLRSPDRRTDGR